ncbi:MAG TPA: LPXTG cell wall anchor domain-containing protein [Thermoanaerobaculia bacterium]|nr:LPXTG cell wall anchor domain-containing protein [Thermoanaerobaculia bacterium]
MKRFTYLTLALFLIVTGAAFAQGPTTSAPTGSSLQREPQPANNDLRNPGNPQDQAGSQTTNNTGTTTATPDSTGTTGTSTYNSNTTGSNTSTDSSTTGTSSTSDSTSAGTTATSSSLPRTGSNMPLFGLLGLIALASAFSLRAFAKREA